MRKRQIEDQLRLRDKEIERLREYYLGVEQLLTDIGDVFPNLVNEHYSGAWFNNRVQPKVIDKLKQREIHTVAQHYRDVEQERNRNRWIDDAMTDIGL